VPRLKSRIPIVPLVLEQYRCYSAVDACNAWLLDIYMVAHQASGNDLYLRKAKALASALTRARRPSGAIATWSWFETAEDARDGKPADLGDWFSCMAYDAHVLMRHEKALK